MAATLTATGNLALAGRPIRQADAGPRRRPAVAGYFYPADPVALTEAIDRAAGGEDDGPETAAVTARAAVLPHGSFRACATVLGRTIRRLRIPARCVILGPSHAARPPSWTLMTQGAYVTPLGEARIDEDAAWTLRRSCAFLEPDPWLQRGEHAIEVPLVMLQRFGPPELSLVPMLGDLADPGRSAQLAAALARMVEEEPTLLIASSDLSQHAPQAVVRRQDHRLLEAIRTLDGARFRQAVDAQGGSVCGAEAVACVMAAARAVGARDADVVHYGTSAEAGGDPASATGYAGVVIR